MVGGRHVGSRSRSLSRSRISGESTDLLLLCCCCAAAPAGGAAVDLGFLFNACCVVDRPSEQPIQSGGDGEMSSVEN